MPQLCTGEQARRLRADRARGGLGRRQHEDDRQARRRRVGDQRRQAVHHQRRHRHLRLRHDHRGHRRAATATQGDLQHHRPQRHPRLRGRRAVPEDGLERLGHPPAHLHRLPRARGQPARAAAATASSSSCRSSTAAGSASPRWASASPRAPSTRRSPTRRSAGPSASRSPSSRRSRRRSPTSRPQIEASRLLVYRAAIEKDRGEPFTLTAAQAKLITGRLAVRATEEAVQIHGGYGYIEEYPVCRFYRDAKILTIGEGTDEVQQMVIARQLGC